MATQNFNASNGYDISNENGEAIVSQLAGSVAPGGDAGPQDAANIGSIYQRTDGGFYRKAANIGATSDWVLMNETDVLIELGPITTVTDLDCLKVDDFNGAEWEVVVSDVADQTNKRKYKISCLHNGDSSNDADKIDNDKFALLGQNFGSNFDHTLSVVLSGTGAAQEFCLTLASIETLGVNVTVRRTSLK